MSIDDLGNAVEDRRVRLGLRQVDLDRLGGPSEGTVRNIEQRARGSYSMRTFFALDRALGWEAGSARAVATHGATPKVSSAELSAAPSPDPFTSLQSAINDDDLALRIGRVVLALVRAEETR